jgi:hypothetical protein
MRITQAFPPRLPPSLLSHLPLANHNLNGRTPMARRELEIAVPRNLVVGESTLTLVGDASAILNDGHARALASAIPPLERMKEWTLSYSTTKHGISLQTLYRKAVPGMATILLIRDFGGESLGLI